MDQFFTVYTRKNLEKTSPNEYKHPVTNNGRFATEEQAEDLAENIRKSGAWAEVGLFYIFSREDWQRDQYKSKIDGKNSTIIAGKHGTTLIFEGIHFEIEGRPEA